MFAKLKVCAFALLVHAAISIDQAFAMAWPWKPDNGNPGNGGASPAPELDGAGALAVFALLASIAIVIFNRTRNK
ncbi:MAG: hypothetical protein J0H65_05105 [Rhizobiales bacterium]|nr:hypothetical protein [Hyphomicrobiales bacterium]